ncbi:MAG: glycoside hydrolase family 88 protein, partial [Spirochaetes bacterium]|nr:glycoside hydrolase family 88 protein [Spirochaetota bacterium]
MIDLSLPFPPESLERHIQERVQKTAELAATKIRLLASRWNPVNGAPVFTKMGKYTSQGWTEWTQGFQFGLPLLVYDLTNEPWFLEYGRNSTLKYMAVHLTHRGVHDHGFNNISTYGNLFRLMKEGKIPENPWEERYYRLALQVSGAVQASRWKDLPQDLGYIYSFNGPQSLFADTIRSLRSLAQAYLLGQFLMDEQDLRINLLRRLLQHAETTARYIVYHGTGRDRWDVRGRTAHEAIFNPINGSFRTPSTQQGYSPFSCWTRGLAWILLGFAEELEFLQTLEEEEVSSLQLPYFPTKQAVMQRFRDVAQATADFYIQTTPPDGIPYWDTGAPNLHHLDMDRPADPSNPYEPVDSSAAAIAAQGLLRLGRFMEGTAEKNPYLQAGLRTAFTLMEEPYLSQS